MSEQYRFMRYYLPGALFFTYSLILIILNLSTDTIKLLFACADWTQIVGISIGILGASPIVGYIIYSLFNEFDYERLAKKNRPALQYIEDLDFVRDNVRREQIQDHLRCFLQKKEFLDLIYHTTLIKDKKENLMIGPEIIQTLKNHLSNFAARRISGLWVPIFSGIFSFLTAILHWAFPIFPGVSFTMRLPQTIFMVTVISIISFFLLYDHMRVLYEAYKLEDYMIRAKSDEVTELMNRLF